MRSILSFLLFFVFCSTSVQDGIPVTASIKTEEFPLENVNTQNISSKKSTFSDIYGNYLLNMQAGDTLLITHVGIQDQCCRPWHYSEGDKNPTDERRLRTAGDFKLIHLLGLLGGSLQVHPILNAINGRTKRLKRNIRIEKQQRNIAFLEIHAMNYMKDKMQLTGAQAQLLIDYIINDSRLQDVLHFKNEARFQFFLQDTLYRLNNEE